VPAGKSILVSIPQLVTVMNELIADTVSVNNEVYNMLAKV
jgi:hypothetical protein